MIKIIVGTLFVIALTTVAATAALAHEDEEEGDYKFVVGFLHEPAYEGERNAVSVRVTKVVAAAVVEEPGSQAHHEPMGSEKDVGLKVGAVAEDEGGVNLYLLTRGWTWSPENVNNSHVPGEGHAHIYVDGEKVGRTYGPYHYLSGLEHGERHIRVTLNSNDHSALTYEGQPVEASTMVTVSRHDHDHSHEKSEPVEADSPMSLEATAHPDTGGAYNLQVVLVGFTFSGENVNRGHAPGEGYANVYVDGKKTTRMYGPWVALPALEPGSRAIRVTLSTNDHRDYSWNGKPVEASVEVNVEADAAMSHTTMESGGGHSAEKSGPVAGLENTLQVEVTHVPSETSKTMNLRAAYGEPGHYIADLIPTSPGHYRFRFFGAVEGNPVDKTFDSMAGGGGFDDVQAASVIHFPETVASAREVEGAVRGAQATAERAQTEAMSAKSDASGASTLGIIGIVVGAVGVALGGGAMLISLRRRN